MAIQTSERIPDFSASALQLDPQVGYDEVVALKDFAVQELYGATHFRQGNHGARNSSARGIIRFAATGDYGTEFEQPETRYSLLVTHNYSPPGWMLLFGAKKRFTSNPDASEETIYRIDTMNQEVWQAFMGTLHLTKRSGKIRLNDEPPTEVRWEERDITVNPLTTEGCIDLLILMDRVMRRGQIEQPARRYSVKRARHTLDINDTNF